MTALLVEIADHLRRRGRERRMTPDHALGRRGEDVAHRFLQRNGITVVARNYRMATGGGEIDLVGWHGDTLVFIEVKSRQTDEFGAPDRAIGIDKKHRLLRAAREFARRTDTPWNRVRFDVVNVIFTTPPSVSHMQDVFRDSA